MTRVRAGAAALLGACVLATAGCGSGGAPASTRPSPEDAFAVRMTSHQQTSLTIARDAARRLRQPALRRIARRMVTTRERLLPSLQQFAVTVRSTKDLPDLGVSPAQAAEEIGPDALAGAKPLDAAFLTTMSAHDQGALALVSGIQRRGRDPQIKGLADRIAVELGGEVARLQAALANLARRAP